MKKLFAKTTILVVGGYLFYLIMKRACSFDDFSFELDEEDILFI